MPAPLDPAVSAAILDAVKAGGRSRAAIAREHGVSAATVGNIARRAGVVDAFDRSATAAATTAALVDNASRRAALETKLLQRAEAELAECDAGMFVGQFGGKDNVWSEKWFDKAPHNVRSTLVATAARALKAAADLAAGSADGVNAHTRSLLEQLAESEPAT